MPPILVNVADLLSYWTNGLLKSAVHRVVFPTGGTKGGQDRYSMAYFLHPANETRLVSIPSERVRARAGEVRDVEDKGRAMTAAEHLNGRLAATYGWNKDEKEGM